MFKVLDFNLNTRLPTCNAPQQLNISTRLPKYQCIYGYNNGIHVKFQTRVFTLHFVNNSVCSLSMSNLDIFMGKYESSSSDLHKLRK